MHCLPVYTICVVAHARDAAIIWEIPSDGGFKSLVVAAGNGDTASMAGAEGFNDVLDINLHSVNTAGGQIGVELIVEIKDLPGVYQAQPMDGKAVHDNIGLVAHHSRGLNWVRQRTVIVFHTSSCWFHPTPISS